VPQGARSARRATTGAAFFFPSFFFSSFFLILFSFFLFLLVPSRLPELSLPGPSSGIPSPAVSIRA
jgi:hypothetical protein